MVRPRIILEKLEGESQRDKYYLHHKSIVSKKVREMSILTGTDIFFLGFSPSGIPTLHMGEHSNLVNIMRRFSQVPYGDREKRRYDNLQTMRANYQKEDEYNVDVENLFNAWKDKLVEEKRKELNDLKEKLADLKLKKSYWKNPKLVNSIEHIELMEQSIQNSLQMVRQRRKEIQEKEMMASRKLVEPTIEPFEDYIPEMLSGNDDLLLHPIITTEDQLPTSGYP